MIHIRTAQPLIFLLPDGRKYNIPVPTRDKVNRAEISGRIAEMPNAEASQVRQASIRVLTEGSALLREDGSADPAQPFPAEALDYVGEVETLQALAAAHYGGNPEHAVALQRTLLTRSFDAAMKGLAGDDSPALD